MRATIPAGLDRKEAEVFKRLDPARLPKHIAIIMDGNGRWARRRHLPRVAGHRAGVTSVRSTVETAATILQGLPVPRDRKVDLEVDKLGRRIDGRDGSQDLAVIGSRGRA